MNMSVQTPEPRTKGAELAQGKTKIIFADLADPLGVILEAKDDITAGDGAKHDVIEHKAQIATKTTCNVFRLLKAAGIPVAFNEQVDEKSFSSPRVTMIPLEVIARREAHGSYCVRNPHVEKGTIFSRLVFELFLKTKDKRWKDIDDLPCDDPLAVFDGKDAFDLYDVKKQFIGQKPHIKVWLRELFWDEDGKKLLQEMERITRKTFLVLEKAWQLLDRRLVDFKIEFALCKGRLLVADVIDNDSWRLLKDGAYEDKQVYRDGGGLNIVAANYRRIADLTDRFGLPRQKVIIWRGSNNDAAAAFGEGLEEFLDGLGGWTPNPAEPNLKESPLSVITCSMHKEATRGLELLRILEQEVPNSVIIAYIGMSNGAGPTLAAHTTLPVINCSPTAKDFPEDIWSSLRMPSNVPCMTVLSPKNAMQAALNILSARNPALYAVLRYKLEERAVNTTDI